jgi:hypothetical protein
MDYGLEAEVGNINVAPACEWLFPLRATSPGSRTRTAQEILKLLNAVIVLERKPTTKANGEHFLRVIFGSEADRKSGVSSVYLFSSLQT